MSLDYLPIENDIAVELRGLKDVLSGEYILDATVTGTLYSDKNESLVVFTLSHIGNGNYRGFIPNTVPLSFGRRYLLVVRAVKDVKKLTIARYLEAKYRND